MAEFHWIGSTGDNITKFFWNNINNWAVKTNLGIVRARTYGRLPQGNDIVKIGTDLHCFSPLLYGGYSGGTGPAIGSGATQGAGHWCMGITAGDITSIANGYTAGVTGGGITLVIATDVPAASSSQSVSAALSYGLINSTVPQADPNQIWGSTNIERAASSFGVDPEVMFFNMLSSINPHAIGIAATGQAITNAESGRYPFPYLGGGISGDIYRYLKSVWGISNRGFSGDSSVKYQNSWVGGGWTGAENLLTSTVVDGLRIRLGGKESIGTKTTLLVSPGEGGVAVNKIFNLDIKTVADKLVGSNQIVTDTILESRGNPMHSYVFRTGSFRSVRSTGDAAISFEACTAGSVQVDYHNYTSVGAMSRLGGIVIDTENNDPRYHPWVLYFAGSITNGARNAVYGTAVGKVDFPWNNKILANTNPSTYSTSFARGMSGFTWSTMNPMIGVGDFGGTGGPIRDTPGASAAYFTSIPTIEMYSNTRDGAPDWDTTRTATERGAVTAYSLEFLGNAAVGEVLAHGANVYFSSRGLQDSTVYLASLKMREGAVADFTRNPEMDAWFIGGFTGATQGIQIVGGILPEDDTCILRMSRGQQLANSKIVGSDGQAGYDARATLFAPENNPTYTPGAINAFSVRSGLNLAGSLPTEVPIDNRAQY